MGEWMQSNGESIYGTTASPFFKLFWGRCTKKEDEDDQILYLHIFDIPENGKILVPGLRNSVKSLRILRDGTEIPFEDQGDDILIDFSGQAPDPYNTVLMMEIEGKADVLSNMPTEQEGQIRLPAAYGFIHNRGYGEQAFLSDLTEEAYVTNWMDAGTRVEFMFSLETPGDYDCRVVAAAAGQVECKLEAETDTLEFGITGAGNIQDFEEREVGIVTLEDPGTQIITLKPAGEEWSEFSLKEIRLVKRLEGN
jgi:alpha-L-fucosidase